MKLGRVLWAGAGAASGAYLVSRWRRNRAIEPEPLTDHLGRVIDPVLVELEGGEPVPVVDAGGGPALVMVPGLSGDRQVFRYQIREFTRTHRVIALDLRTGFDGVERGFDQFAHDVVTVMTAREVESAVLFGLSFGGPIVIRVATLFPDRVEGLVLTATLTRLDLSHVGLNRTLFIPVARWGSRYLPVPLMRRLADVWGRWGIWVFDPSEGNERIIEYELGAPAAVPAAVGGLRMDTFREVDLGPDLAGIRQPALVIAGSADSYTPPEWQREIAAELPNARYVEIPQGGHLSLISRAEPFNAAVSDWLEAAREGAAEAGSSSTGTPEVRRP